MDFAKISGKKIALLIINAEQENDMHVYLGELAKVGPDFIFSNQSNGWQVHINDEQFSRLTEVTPDMKDLFLGADYFISLTMSAISDEDQENANSTGMKWH